MTQEEINEGNKLIAEFMEWQQHWLVGGNKMAASGIERLYGFYVPKELTTKTLHGHPFEDFECLKFSSSWDWLMPVVEKIESLTSHDYFSVEFSLIGNECEFGIHIDAEHYRGIAYENHETKIDSVYKAVVQFIKWHNLNETEN